MQSTRYSERFDMPLDAPYRSVPVARKVGLCDEKLVPLCEKLISLGFRVVALARGFYHRNYEGGYFPATFSVRGEGVEKLIPYDFGRVVMFTAEEGARFSLTTYRVPGTLSVNTVESSGTLVFNTDVESSDRFFECLESLVDRMLADR